MSDSENEEVADLSSPDVTTKYNAAATITNKALAFAVEKAVVGACIYEVCQEVNALLESETGKLYNKKGDKKKVDKGIAFPCSISVNELCGHFAPLKNESRLLEAGDLAKIDLACHIDGYVAAAAHTVLVGGLDVSADDARADVVHCAWTTAEALLRKVKVGNTNMECTKVIRECADEFGCNPMQGVLSHQLKKHVIDGNQCIINCATPEEKVDEFEFGMNEVYCIDVIVSTGEGKAKESEIRTTVYRRALENTYALKTQKGRQFLSEVGKRFPTMPFSLTSFGDETMSRVGASECNRHELLHAYPVLHEKNGCFVAQFKYTVLLLPAGTKRITGLPFVQQGVLKTEKCVKNEELKALLATSANPKKAKKKQKKAEA